MEEEGYYQTSSLFYLKTFLFTISLLCISWSLMIYGNINENSWVQLISAFFLGIYLQQVAFMGHDLGHNSVTHVNKYDNYIGLIIGNLMSGISLGWWKDSHNTHHVVPNSV